MLDMKVDAEFMLRGSRNEKSRFLAGLNRRGDGRACGFPKL
jgi:hypothetical protein